jgi:hypothetical protein
MESLASRGQAQEPRPRCKRARLLPRQRGCLGPLHPTPPKALLCARLVSQGNLELQRRATACTLALARCCVGQHQTSRRCFSGVSPVVFFESGSQCSMAELSSGSVCNRPRRAGSFGIHAPPIGCSVESRVRRDGKTTLDRGLFVTTRPFGVGIV